MRKEGRSGRSAFFGAFVLREGRVQLSRDGLVVYVDRTGLGRQISHPCLAISPKLAIFLQLSHLGGTTMRSQLGVFGVWMNALLVVKCRPADGSV